MNLMQSVNRNTLVIVSTCHLYLLPCAGCPLYKTEGIIGQDVLRITGMDTNYFGLGAQAAIHVNFTLWE